MTYYQKCQNCHRYAVVHGTATCMKKCYYCGAQYWVMK